VRVDEYVRYDGTGLAGLLRRREVTALELAQAAGRVWDAVNPELNAVVRDFRERAFDGLERRGTPTAGPFAGVPFLVKDNLEIADLPVSFGSVLAKDLVGRRTHPVARALEHDAGLVFLGRTNMCELGLLPTTEPALYGPTRNPWDPSRSPGGSSGGAAAAVVAGIVPMAHGNDGGGSIRIPASACGLFGLKPSAGRAPASLADHPSGFQGELALTRSVRDAAALLDVLSGAAGEVRGWQRPSTPPRPFAELAAEAPAAPLRIGFRDRDYHGNPAHPACREAVARAAGLLAELGHRVEEASPAVDGESYDAGFLTFWSMAVGYVLALAREGLLERARSRGLPGPVRALLGRRKVLSLALRARAGRPPLEPITRELLRIEESRTPGEVWLAWQRLNQGTAALDAFFETHDLLLTPTLAEPPWPTGHLDEGAGTAELRRRLQRYAPFTPLANTSGVPAMSVPLHRTAAGLPIGVQLVAPYGREDLLLRLAAQLEGAAPWWPPPIPPVFSGAGPEPTG